MNFAIKLVLGIIDKMPFGSYRTYIINVALIAAWIGYVAFGGDYEIAAVAIGASLSAIFMRKSNEAQADKLMYIEGLLQEVTVRLHERTRNAAAAEAGLAVLAQDPIDPASVSPQGPHADTIVRE